jgi:peptidoglycan/LPS O-acetylase OafA/YrhL
MADKKKKILSIEAIRGISAIYVMLGHIVQHYQPYNSFPKYEFITKTIFGYGHQAVLLFFIVSGFSITYSSSNINLSDPGSIKDYFFKRLRRIYPLFLIVLIISLISLLIAGIQSDAKRNILSFFFLTDIAPGSIANPIPTNFPIWSLSYEVVYYLLFPLLILSWQKIGMKRTFFIVLLSGMVAGMAGFAGWPNHLFNIWQYYWIWIAGAMLAKAFMNMKRFQFRYLNGVLISSVAFMLTFEKVPVVMDWFWSLMFLTIFFAYFIGIERIPLKSRLLNIIIGFVSVLICYFLTRFRGIVYHSDIIRILLFVIAGSSILLNLIPPDIPKNLIRLCLKPFVRSGSFSYALYISHWPIITISVFFYEKFFGASILHMSIGICLNMMVIFFLSWYLEEKLQPVIETVLNKWYYKSKSHVS